MRTQEFLPFARAVREHEFDVDAGLQAKALANPLPDLILPFAVIHPLEAGGYDMSDELKLGGAACPRMERLEDIEEVAYTPEILAEAAP